MRVTVEDRLFGERRLHRLAQIMGWPVRSALGALVYLWHESQALGISHATADEIEDWCWYNNDCDEPGILLDALIKTGFVSCLAEKPDLYYIHGNMEVIQRIDEFKHSQADKAKKGGEATKEKWHQLALVKARTRPAGLPGQGPRLGCSGQDSTEQNSTYTSPLPPSLQEGGKTKRQSRRREVSDQAAAMSAKAIGAVRNGLPPDQAEAYIGRDGWLLVLAEWGSWESFQRAYAISTAEKRSGGSDAMIFKSQLTRSLKALLMQAPETYQPKELA